MLGGKGPKCCIFMVENKAVHIIIKIKNVNFVCHYKLFLFSCDQHISSTEVEEW